jgi:hypothetical protein
MNSVWHPKRVDTLCSTRETQPALSFGLEGIQAVTGWFGILLEDTSSAGEVGLEHPTNTPGNTAHSELGGAKSGAQRAPHAVSDLDLTQLINVWPTLTPVVRAGIIAMVKASIGHS